MVTASLTTPAIWTVTALVTETSTNSVKTCNKRNKLILLGTMKLRSSVLNMQHEKHVNVLISFGDHETQTKRTQYATRKACKCIFPPILLFDINSYHEKGQSSAGKHQQQTPSDMPWVIEIIIPFEFMPWIQQ